MHSDRRNRQDKAGGLVRRFWLAWSTLAHDLFYISITPLNMSITRFLFIKDVIQLAPLSMRRPIFASFVEFFHTRPIGESLRSLEGNSSESVIDRSSPPDYDWLFHCLHRVNKVVHISALVPTSASILENKSNLAESACRNLHGLIPDCKTFHQLSILTSSLFLWGRHHWVD